MAGAADRRTFALAVGGAGLAFVLARFPFGDAASGLWFLATAVASFVLLGLPLLVAEAALGQYRRRNVVDAHGAGAWRLAGLLHVAGAVAAIALVALLAGYAARLFVGTFEGAWLDDPDRHLRLLTAGPDALLWALGALAVAVAVAVRSGRSGMRGTVAACAIGALVLLAGVALWATLQDGAAAGRTAIYDPAPAFTASQAVAAVFAGLLPALLATGIATTLGARVAGRDLPRQAAGIAVVLFLGVAFAVLALGSLASSHGLALHGDGALTAFGQAADVFGVVGGGAGGVLAGAFYLALLLASLVALLALVEVPATWLTESHPEAGWTEARGVLAAALAAALLLVPFAFSRAAVGHLHEALLWVAAPLGGLLAALHVGWVRPEVLSGYVAGDARHPVDRFLVPALRYVLSPALLLLVVLGLLGFASAMGWTDATGGLWRLAP